MKYKVCLKCAEYVNDKCKLGCQGYKQYFTQVDKEGIKDIKPNSEPIIAGIVACGAFASKKER